MKTEHTSYEMGNDLSNIRSSIRSINAWMFSDPTQAMFAMQTLFSNLEITIGKIQDCLHYQQSEITDLTGSIAESPRKGGLSWMVSCEVAKPKDDYDDIPF